MDTFIYMTFIINSADTIREELKKKKFRKKIVAEVQSEKDALG